MKPYTKKHATPEDHVNRLISQGLHVPRPNVAARKIKVIGYERLRIYFLSRRDQPEKRFRPGTTFRDIVNLYECDSRFRGLAFEAVGRFELAFRNAISDTLSERFGSHPYDDLNAFKDVEAHGQALCQVKSTFNKKASKDPRARHYCETYNRPVLPPIWLLKEFLTFGDAARLYDTLCGPLRKDVARKFDVSERPVFDNWVKCFVDLRNLCAHHDRLFNRPFQKGISRLERKNVPVKSTNTNTLRAYLECLDHALEGIGETGGSVAKAKRVINLQTHAAIDPKEAGF